MTGATPRQGRFWGVVTFSADPPTYDAEEMRYMMRVKHAAPTNGHEHWHAYIQFKKRQRLTGVKRAICDSTAHCEVLQTDDTHYLEDGHSTIHGPEEFGKKVKAGQRKDIESFKEALDRGDSISAIAKEHFACWCRYGKLIGEYRLLQSSYKAKYPPESFLVAPISDWSKHYHLWGPPDTGKTQYALAQFKNPLYVRHADHLKMFDATGHDGIVIDEMNFTHWPISAVINLLNKKDPAHIHIRYSVAYLPPGVRIIFCSNEEDIFYNPMQTMDPSARASVDAKHFKIHVDKRMFGDGDPIMNYPIFATNK